jgi:hypothetical protein
LMGIVALVGGFCVMLALGAALAAFLLMLPGLGVLGLSRLLGTPLPYVHDDPHRVEWGALGELSPARPRAMQPRLRARMMIYSNRPDGQESVVTLPAAVLPHRGTVSTRWRLLRDERADLRRCLRAGTPVPAHGGGGSRRACGLPKRPASKLNGGALEGGYDDSAPERPSAAATAALQLP